MMAQLKGTKGVDEELYCLPITTRNHASTKSHPLRERDGGGTRALVTLSSHDHVVERAKVEANTLPGINVSAEVDGAAGAVVAADSPVLLEGGGALDGRLVGAGGLEEGVGAAVDLGRAHGGGGGGGIVGAEGLDDVELDKRALGPAVEGEVPVAASLDVGLVGDGPAVFVSCLFPSEVNRLGILLGRGRVPAQTRDDVAGGLGPLKRVGAATDGHGGTGVGLNPVRVVVVTSITGGGAG